MNMKRVEEIHETLGFADVMWHKPMLNPESAADDFVYLIDTIKQQQEQIKKKDNQLSGLVLAIYEHASEGTELMELAEQVDESE